MRGDNALKPVSCERHLLCMIILLSNDVQFNPGPLNETLSEHPTQIFLKAKDLKIAHINIYAVYFLWWMSYATFNVFKSLRCTNCFWDIWLNESIDDAEVSLPGYTFIRRDRISQHGGGLITFVKDSLPYLYRQDLNNEENEVLWIEMARNKCKRLLIANVYRLLKMSLNDFLTLMESSIAKIESRSFEKIILWGFYRWF